MKYFSGSAAAGWTALALALAPALRAQSLGLTPEDEGPAWLRTWSALGDRSNLPRRVGVTGFTAPSFLELAPRLGLFWTAGNPAGLVAEMPAPRTDAAFGWAQRQGSYRRPLDPGATEAIGARARSWRAVGSGLALLGRVAIDRTRLDPGTRADATEPFGTSPFVTTDTIGAPVRQLRAALEGAASWQLGDWALGVTLGYSSEENTSIASPVVRRVGIQTPGLVAGAARRFGSVTIGVHGRFRHRAETIRLTERAAEARVYELSGWGEPPIVDVVVGYHRRREENVAAVGGSVAATLGELRLAGYVEADRLRERLWRLEQNDPPEDRWDADGWSGGVALQRPLGSDWLLTLNGRIATVDGEARLQTDSAAVFAASERELEAQVELRRRLGAGPWALALAVGVRSERRARRDLRLDLPAEVRATTPTARFELGWMVSDRLFLSAGTSVATYGPTSRIPNPATQGPLYRSYFAPDLALMASDAWAWSSVGLLWYRISGATWLWLASRTHRVSAWGETQALVRPDGARTALSLTSGVTIGLP